MFLRGESFQENRLAQGGEAFDYVPCLNSSEPQVALYEQIVLRHARHNRYRYSLSPTRGPGSAASSRTQHCAWSKASSRR